MNVRNQVAGGDKNENADKECGNIDEQENGQVDLHRSLADVVGLRVEPDDAGIFLQQNDAEANDITQQQTLTDDEGWEPEERVADCLVAGSDSLQDTNHLCALKDDDEQSADHREACHTNHQCQDDPDIDVEQL